MYAREEKSCSWNNNTCYKAAKNGHLNCLKFAHENGCEWNKWTIEYAAERGHLDCLKYAYENGCDYELYSNYIHPNCKAYFDNMTNDQDIDQNEKIIDDFAIVAVLLFGKYW
jgi:hypothetical protein